MYTSLHLLCLRVCNIWMMGCVTQIGGWFAYVPSNRDFSTVKIVLLWSIDRVDLLIRFKYGKFGSATRINAVCCLYCVVMMMMRLYKLIICFAAD